MLDALWPSILRRLLQPLLWHACLVLSERTLLSLVPTHRQRAQAATQAATGALGLLAAAFVQLAFILMLGLQLAQLVLSVTPYFSETKICSS